MVTRGEKPVTKEKKSVSKNIMQTAIKQALSKPCKSLDSELSPAGREQLLLSLPPHPILQGVHKRLTFYSVSLQHLFRPSRKLGEMGLLLCQSQSKQCSKGLPSFVGRGWVSLSDTPWTCSHPSWPLLDGSKERWQGMGLFRDVVPSLLWEAWPEQATHQIPLSPVKVALFVKGFRGQEAINRVKQPRRRG